MCQDHALAIQSCSLRAYLSSQSPHDFEAATFLLLLAGESEQARKPLDSAALTDFASRCCRRQLMPGNAVEAAVKALRSNSQYLVLCLPSLAEWNLSTVRCVQLDLKPICAVAQTAAFHDNCPCTVVCHNEAIPGAVLQTLSMPAFLEAPFLTVQPETTSLGSAFAPQ